MLRNGEVREVEGISLVEDGEVFSFSSDIWACWMALAGGYLLAGFAVRRRAP